MAKTPRPNTPQNQTPAGTIIAFSGNTASFTSETSDGTTFLYKDGWAVCNGASISQTTYSQLYARLSTTWNTAANPLTGSAQAAPSSGFFRVPNLQGTFLRGVGDFSDNTKDTSLAGFQSDQLQGHKHELPLYYNTSLGAGGAIPDGLGSASVEYQNIGIVRSDPTYGTVSVGTETRSQNVGVYYLVKLYDFYT
jgi:microcystin-dependent protein